MSMRARPPRVHVRRLGRVVATTTVVLLTATVFTRAQTNQILSPFGKLPLHFEQNQGQTDAGVQYLARGRGYTLFLTPTEAVLGVRRFEFKPNKPLPKDRAHRTKEKYEHMVSATLTMRLAGANGASRVTGLDALSGRVNYFVGNDPAKWVSDVPTYAKSGKTGGSPGVDVVYYGNEGQLEYDFVVAPHADSSA